MGTPHGSFILLSCFLKGYQWKATLANLFSSSNLEMDASFHYWGMASHRASSSYSGKRSAIVGGFGVRVVTEMMDCVVPCLLLIPVNHGFQVCSVGYLTVTVHCTYIYIWVYRGSYHRVSQIASINHQCSWVNVHKFRISPHKYVAQILVVAGGSKTMSWWTLSFLLVKWSNCNDLTATEPWKPQVLA